MPSHIVHIEAKITWRAKRTPHGYVAVCDDLGVTAQGATWSDLQAMMVEVMDMLFFELFKENELEKFLRSRGWRPVSPLPPTDVVPDVRFDVPFEVDRGTMNALA